MDDIEEIVKREMKEDEERMKEEERMEEEETKDYSSYFKAKQDQQKEQGQKRPETVNTVFAEIDPTVKPVLAVAPTVAIGELAPKYPSMALATARWITFQTPALNFSWEIERVSTIIKELVESGFFFFLPPDTVKCFQCGVALYSWEEEDEV